MRSILLILFLFQTSSALAQKTISGKATSGKFDFNYYRDTRAYNVMTINLLANQKGRFEYFSLVDYFSRTNESETTDKDLFYTEQNLRYYLSDEKFMALSTQAVMSSGPRNDLYRAGLLVIPSKTFAWKEFFKLNNIFFAINFFPIQADYQDGFSWQIEYFYSLLIAPTLFNERLYLSGFADQNVLDGNTTWVTEHQLGYRFYDNFFAVTEYRINENFNKKTGFGIGLEYLLPF